MYFGFFVLISSKNSSDLTVLPYHYFPHRPPPQPGH